MSLIYALFSLLVLVVVGYLSWRSEKQQGEDYEWDSLAIAKNLVITLIVLVAAWNVAKIVSTHIVDYWWYQEVGYPEVWVTTKTVEWSLRLAGFVIAYLALTITQWIAQFFVPGLPSGMEDGPRVSPGVIVAGRYYRGVSRLLKFFVALGFSWGATLLQNPVLKLGSLVEWAVRDPIFGNDYAFYDAVLPALNLVWWEVTLLVVIAAVGTALAYYYLQERMYSVYGRHDEVRSARLTDGVFNHTFLFAAGFALLLAFRAQLGRFDMLVDGSSKVISGAGFIDVTVKITALEVMTWVWTASAVVLLIGVFLPRRFKRYPPYLTGSLAIAAWLISLVIIPGVKRLQLNTNPLGFERPYIEHQIEGTRFAFGLDKIEDQGQLGYVNQMSSEDLLASNVTLSQARIVDWQPMLSANETLNEYLTFYNFADVDIDRYNDEEVMLSVREVNRDQIPEDARNWVNIHFRYTHGYGYTVASVSEVDTIGEPSWLVRNLPPIGPDKFMVDRPEIYFGERTYDYVFVGGNLTEFGRPEGQTMQEVTYDGPAGINIGGFWRRVALAMMTNDYRLVFTNLIDSDSRIILNRTLNQRFSKLGWFLRCDEDPYAVLGGEEVVYIRDCYTTSTSVPYSHFYSDVRYMRGSVKMTVGAWSGETRLYVVDESDPIIQTWMAVYPDLFRPFEEMPQYLKEHIRYPDDLIRAQADAYALYHVDTPEAFFNRQDLWERAKETQLVEGAAEYAEPRYVMMVIPGGEKEEFVSNIFFTPLNKQNIVAGMIARSDGDAYGELVVYQFPRDETVIGMQMLEARINQHEALSKDISLLNVEGSRVLWGQTIGLVLPSEGNSVSLVYIRALYLQSEGSRIPSVKKVIISQGDRLLYENSLESTLSLLYGGTIAQPRDLPTEVAPGDFGALNEQALMHFEAVQTCAAQGDWICFGREMDALYEVLTQGFSE